ncbi:hypothetical protein [Sphingosinicella sp. BN140058]|uniref:hypothetical protein n=1 Tax=Sphingosinicella sp. BN140058 TaxID=1892855 RepID=UPI0010126691|nr:hypothetical protein [Sphingosinicella sp. BN140058]QAY75936.1 hypothetical protein ETR14_04890 [Sphingosinicella sp. BN140058]
MKQFIAIVAAGCVACATTGAPSGLAADYDVRSILSAFQAGTAPQGRPVSVSGYLTFGDDKHNLWASEKDCRDLREAVPPPGDPAWRRCVALADYGRFRSKLLKNDGKSVVITGTLVRHVPDPDEINLGACSDLQISLGGEVARVAAP